MNPYKLTFPWSVLCSVYRYRCRAGESRQRSHIPPSRWCLVLVRSRRETLVPSVWSSACTSRAGREPGAPERLQTKPLTPLIPHYPPSAVRLGDAMCCPTPAAFLSRGGRLAKAGGSPGLAAAKIFHPRSAANPGETPFSRDTPRSSHGSVAFQLCSERHQGCSSSAFPPCGQNPAARLLISFTSFLRATQDWFSGSRLPVGLFSTRTCKICSLQMNNQKLEVMG